MPKVDTKRKVVTWDAEDWLIGMNSQDGVGVPISKGHDIMRAMDPFRYEGYICPGLNPVDATNASVVDAILTAADIGSDGNLFAVGGTKIHEINPSTGALVNDAGTTYPITVTATKVTDIITYYTGTNAYLFYAWYDGTDADIGRVPADTPGSDDPDFMSTTPTDGAVFAAGESNDIILFVGHDDVMYIGAGNAVHAYDGQEGANGTYYADVLTLPKGFIITGFAKIEPRLLAIFAYRKNNSGVELGESVCLLWNYIDEDPEYVYPLANISRTGGAFQFNGTIGCFGIDLTKDRSSSLRVLSLMLFDGEKFVVKKTAKITTGSVIPPVQSGIQVIDKFIYANVNGECFAFEPAKGEYKLHKILKGDGTTSGGILVIAENNKYLMSSGTTTSGGLNIFKENYSGDISYLYSAHAVIPMNENKYCKARKVRVELMQSVSAKRALSIDILDSDASNFAQIFNAKTTINSITEQNYTYDNNELGTFEAPQLAISYESGLAVTDAPIVKKVELFYEEINIE